MRRFARASGWAAAGLLSVGWVSVARVLIIAAGFRRLQRKHPEMVDPAAALAAVLTSLERDGNL